MQWVCDTLALLIPSPGLQKPGRWNMYLEGNPEILDASDVSRAE